MSDTEAPEAPETSKVICDICGAEAKSVAGLAAHKRFKHATAEASPPAPPPQAPPPSQVLAAFPMKLPGMPRVAGPQLERAVRDHKLLRPQCMECAPEVEAAGHGWWNRCTHDPYVGEKGFPDTAMEYDDEYNAEGQLVGRIVRAGYPKTKVVLRPWPNIVGIADMPRLGGGRGVYFKTVLYGFIEPEALVSPAYPNGIAPMCEFYDCFWQSDLKTYGDNGTYCQEAEAIAIYESLNGTPVEINNPEVRKDQLAVSRMKMLRGA